MLVLGISGGLDSLYRKKTDYGFRHGRAHDSAAVLIKDGIVVAAIEEERLTRIKHTNRFPCYAIQAVLAYAGKNFSDIDYISVNLSEKSLSFLLRQGNLENKFITG